MPGIFIWGGNMQTWIQFIAGITYQPADVYELEELDKALSILKQAALTMGQAGIVSARANLQAQVSPSIMRAIGG